MKKESIAIRVAALHPPENNGHVSTTFVLDGVLAVDAGALASRLSLAEQRQIRHVLITHSHLDHVHELPQFIDNMQSGRDPGNPPYPLEVHGEDLALDQIEAHIFNGLWPNVIGGPFRLATLRPFRLNDRPRLSIAGMKITPFRTVHRVPTVGYIFRKTGVAIAIVADTGFREDILEPLAQEDGLQLLAIEISYPNRLDGWAREHGHLTPQQLLQALAPVRAARPGVMVLVHHIKPAFAEEVQREMEMLVGQGITVQLARDGRKITVS